MEPGDDIDVRGVTFTHDLLTELLKAFHGPHGHPQVGTASFRDAIFTGDAEFGHAAFSGDAEFSGATFSKDAWFEGATFSGDAEFSGATFTTDAWFEGAAFSGKAAFSGATFSGDAEFSGATFSERASFGSTVFTGTARFDGGIFSGDAWFYGGTFSGDARFQRVTFTGTADFSGVTFAQEAWFMDSVVHSELVAEAVAKHVFPVGLRGAGRMSLRLRAAEVNLSDTVLAGPVSVHGLHDPLGGVDEAAFRDETGQVPPVRVMSLRGLDSPAVTLTDVDLSRCRFAGLQRADQLVLDGRCVFADGPGGRRQVLAEEHYWRAGQAGGRPQETGGWLPDPDTRSVGGVVGPARLEVLYRQLRKALEDAKNEPGAADFYYGEMEMRRAATTRRAERWLLGLYWVLSGYGLRARRAAAWLALIAVCSIAGMTWFGFPHTATEQFATGTVTTPAGRQPIDLTIRQADPVTPFADRLETATEVTVNAVIFRNADTDLTTAGRYLNIITRILGPILLGLTILAIRNQVKR